MESKPLVKTTTVDQPVKKTVVCLGGGGGRKQPNKGKKRNQKPLMVVNKQVAAPKPVVTAQGHPESSFKPE